MKQAYFHAYLRATKRELGEFREEIADDSPVMARQRLQALYEFLETQKQLVLYELIGHEPDA